MKRSRWVSVLLALAAAVLGAYGCAAALPHATVSDTRYAARRWPGATLAQLEQGRTLYVETCAGCHELRLPDSQPPERWQAAVAEMRSKRGLHLSDARAQLIVRYLWTMSARARRQELSRR